MRLGQREGLERGSSSTRARVTALPGLAPSRTPTRLRCFPPSRPLSIDHVNVISRCPPWAPTHAVAAIAAATRCSSCLASDYWATTSLPFRAIQPSRSASGSATRTSGDPPVIHGPRRYHRWRTRPSRPRAYPAPRRRGLAATRNVSCVGSRAIRFALYFFTYLDVPGTPYTLPEDLFRACLISWACAGRARLCELARSRGGADAAGLIGRVPGMLRASGLQELVWGPKLKKNGF